MAKKDKFELDDFGFEKELDFPDFDFDIKPPKDDRKPVTKAAQGVLKGAKDTAFSNQFVKRFIKKALPKGYGDAMEMVGEGMGEASKLYNTTAKEIKPTIKELKKVAGRAMPHVEGKLPKGLAEKLKKWTASSDEGQSSQDYRESGISAQLGEIFAEQMKEASKSAQQGEVRDAIKESVDKRRHSDIFEQLEGIRLSTARLSAYQDKVTVNFQRKSLELQYRQYYIAADMLEEQKKANEQFKANLAEIVKNTGLPEYAKLQNSERLGDMMRNKFMSNIYDTIFDKRKGYAGKVVNRLGTKIKDKVTGFASDLQSGLSAADMAMDAGDSMREMGGPGMDPYEMAGGVAGGMAMDSLGNRVGKRVGQAINKSRFGRKVRTVGNNLEYGVKNASQIGDKFSRGDYDYDEGLAGKIISAISKLPGGEMAMDALKEAAYSGRPDQSFKVDGIKDMQAPAIFSNQTRKSINEVIPGFLARIYQELQIIRTGDSKIGLTEYDYGSNKFASSKELMGNMMSRIVNKDQTERFQKDNHDLINQVDPEGKLNKKERSELGKFFLSDNFKNGLGDPKRFTDPSQFRGVSAGTAKKAAKLFGSSFGVDEFGGIGDKEAYSSKRNKFSNAYSNLGSGFGDSRDMIQQILNLGNHDMIRQAGLMNEKGEFDPDQLHKYMAGGTAPTGKAGGRRKKTGKFSMVPSQQDNAANNGLGNSGSSGTDYTDTLKEILDAINKANSVEFDRTTSEASTRIEKILLEGQIGAEAKASGGGAENKRWYQASIGDIMGSISSGVSSGLSYAGDQLQKGAKGAVKLGKGILGTGLDIGKKSADWLLKKRDEFCDIYIKGEVTPRIQAWRLRAGHYIDEKTGEVIRKLSDIKGNVIDRDGNIILSFEDMKNIIPPDGRSYAKKAIDGLISFGKNAIKTTTGFYGTVFNVAKIGLKTAKEQVTKLLARDVYVSGEDNPRLLAITMRVGGYRSKITGKTIWRPLQIDGPVLNTDGEIVLSDADLKKGIVDSDGKPFKSIVSKIFNAGKNAVASTLKTIKKAAKWTAGKAADTIDIVTQFIKNGLGVEGVGGLGIGGRNKSSKLVVDRLTEIRDLLKDRLPERKKKILGDLDGDGDRENSWQDMDQRRAAGKNASGIGGIGGTGVKLLGGKKAEGKKEGDEDEDGMGLGDAKAGWDLAKDGWKGAKNLGGKAMKGMGRWGGKALGWGAKLLGMGEAASAVAGATGIGAAATGAGAAATGAAATTAAAGTAAAAGGAAAGGGILAGIGGVLGTAAAGIAGILSSPVVLGALAVAAVAGGAYLGYKYLTKKKLEPLSTYRFAQYGFTVKDTDALQKVFGLEEKLTPSVDFGKGGATLKEDVPLKDMLDVFNINPSNKKMVYRFTQWFQYRFKPVFLTHMSALKGIAPGVNLPDVDSKLKGEEKKKYFDASRFPNGPYSAFDSPVDDRDRLTVSSMDVENAAKVCEEELKKDSGDSKSATGMEEGKSASAVAAAAAMATANTAMSPEQAASGPDNGNRPVTPESQDGILNQAKNALNRVSGMGSETGLGMIQTPDVENNEKQISPLNAIRYRSYGLYNLEISKINNLLTLEQIVMENMNFSGDGVKWDGNIDDVITKCGAKFGVTNYNTRHGENFAMWFNARFLPIFYNYVGTIYNLTGKKNVKEAAKLLTPSQILAVANAVYTSKGDYNGGSFVSIWSMPVSPWADYVVNTNEATVHDSVKALTDKAKDDVGGEKVPTKKADALTQPSLDSDKSKDQAQQNMGLWDKTKDMASKAGNWIAEKAGAAWDATKNAAGAAASGISNAVSSAASKAKEVASNAYNAVGTAVGKVADGVGGMLDQVPMPTVGGSYAALKDTITAASKMVGVDDKLMSIMAAIESGFNYSVKAGTSSATGLYQFIKSTWDYMVKNYGAKYGIGPGTSPTDPRANALMGAEFLKMNMSKLAPSIGRQPTYTDMYLAHFMGDGGARKFLAAMAQNSSAPAAVIFPKEAGANPSIFYKDKERQQPRTLQEIYNHFTDMINKKAKSFKIDTGAGSSQQAANDPKAGATAPAGSPPQGTGVAPGTDPKASGGGAVAGATTPGGAVPAGASAAPTGGKTAEMIAADSKKGGNASAPGNAPGVPASAGPVQAGFSQGSQQVATQVQTSKDDFNKSIGTVDKTLIESLEVQKASYKVLQDILTAISTGGIKTPNAADSGPKGPTKTGAKEEMQAAPVPMRKQA